MTATGKHPFWVAGGKNAWRDAEQLKPGERLLTEAGSQARIDATKSWTTSRQRVHNLTVADLHTYYVLAGATPVLVHNSTPCGPGGAPGRLTETLTATSADDDRGGWVFGGVAAPAEGLAEGVDGLMPEAEEETYVGAVADLSDQLLWVAQAQADAAGDIEWLVSVDSSIVRAQPECGRLRACGWWVWKLAGAAWNVRSSIPIA